MGRLLKLSFEERPFDPATVVTPALPWFVFNNSWHLRCPLIGGASPGPVIPDPGEGPDFTTNLDFFNNAFVWCDAGRYGPWVCERVELIRYFDWMRSRGTTFDHDMTDRPDYFSGFPAGSGGEAHGTLASRPVFANAGAGISDLTADSEARDNGWVRQVTAPPARPGAPPSSVPIRPQPGGTLNQGRLQDYGLTQVPELEAQMVRLLVEMGVTGRASKRRRSPRAARVAGSTRKPAASRARSVSRFG